MIISIDAEFPPLRDVLLRTAAHVRSGERIGIGLAFTVQSGV